MENDMGISENGSYQIKYLELDMVFMTSQYYFGHLL